jgi:transcription antitermination factor NusG
VRITAGLFAGRLGVCARITRQGVEVLLFMFGAQRQIQLSRDAIEVV